MIQFPWTILFLIIKWKHNRVIYFKCKLDCVIFLLKSLPLLLYENQNLPATMKSALNYLTPAHLPNLPGTTCPLADHAVAAEASFTFLKYTKSLPTPSIYIYCPSAWSALYPLLCMAASFSVFESHLKCCLFQKAFPYQPIPSGLLLMSSFKTFQQYLDICNTFHNGLVVYLSVYHLSRSLDYRYMRTGMPSMCNAVSLAYLAGSSCSINS